MAGTLALGAVGARAASAEPALLTFGSTLTVLGEQTAASGDTFTIGGSALLLS